MAQRGVMLIAASLFLYGASLSATCVGDCNSDGAVTVDEIVRGINIATGSLPVDACPAMGCGCGVADICVDIVINCLEQAVNSLLFNCPVESCGGFAGLQCAANEICDLHDPTCMTADLAGTCTSKPEICPEIAQPVCGCDGQTYSNDCERLRAGVTLAHAGACGAISTPSPTVIP